LFFFARLEGRKKRQDDAEKEQEITYQITQKSK